MRQFYGCNDGFIPNAYFVVSFVTFFQSPQHRYGAVHVRFVHQHRLKTAFESFIVFEIFLIFLERSGAYSPQFAFGQGRLKNIGGIERPIRSASPNKGMYFINKKNNLPIGGHHFFNDCLEPFFKLAFVLSPGNKRPHVKRENHLRLQVLGHIALDYTVGKALGNGCFSYTRLTNKDRIVLGTARQYLQYPPDFFLTSNHRVKFTC
ncbi:MAG: hypothetical protein BWY70_01294 [Bacteroidetes bacterium ADurb.Bin408]|nr:MAG: hypothetical protein BWY70_01294 [Bacteroidetes bacterium ADurb.Bin408]